MSIRSQFNTTNHPNTVYTSADFYWEEAKQKFSEVDRSKLNQSMLPKSLRRAFGSLSPDETKLEDSQKLRQLAISSKVDPVLNTIAPHVPFKHFLRISLNSVYGEIYPADFSDFDILELAKNKDSFMGYRILHVENNGRHFLMLNKKKSKHTPIVGSGTSSKAKFCIDLQTGEIFVANRVLKPDAKNIQARRAMDEFLRQKTKEGFQTDCLMLTYFESNRYTKKTGVEACVFIQEFMQEGCPIKETSPNVFEPVPMSANDALNVIDNCLSGLVQLEALGIYHRDLKAENIFLSRDPNTRLMTAKIADFDHAVFISDPDCGITKGHFGSAYTTYPALHLNIEKGADKANIIQGYTENDIFGTGLVLMTIINNKEPDWLELDIDGMQRPAIAREFQKHIEQFRLTLENIKSSGKTINPIYQMVYEMVLQPKKCDRQELLSRFRSFSDQDKKEFAQDFASYRKN